MWFDILKNPILEGSDIPHGFDGRYSLATNMASQKKHAAGIVWESEDQRARGYAFIYGSEKVKNTTPMWLITVFEVLDSGQGKGRDYLKEFINDLYAKKDYKVWTVTVLPDSKGFWEKMVQEGIISGQTKYYFPDDEEE